MEPRQLDKKLEKVWLQCIKRSKRDEHKALKMMDLHLARDPELKAHASRRALQAAALTPEDLTEEEKALLLERVSKRLPSGKTPREAFRPAEIADMAEQIVCETRGKTSFQELIAEKRAMARVQALQGSGGEADSGR